MTQLGSAQRQSDVLNAAYLEYGGVLPIARQDGRMLVATWRDEVDVEVLDDLALLFDAELVLERFEEDEVRAAIRRAYGSDATAQGVIDSVASSMGSEDGELTAIDDLLALANE